MGAILVQSTSLGIVSNEAVTELTREPASLEPAALPLGTAPATAERRQIASNRLVDIG
jgi:hypothetical protein